MRVLACLVLGLSLSAFAQSKYSEKYDYQKCQFNTNKLFQVGSKDGKAFPRIFDIDEKTNTLVPNDDHTSLSMMDVKTGEYRFTKTSKEKIRLSKIALRKHRSDAPGTSYSFLVKRDDEDRITSISMVNPEDGIKKTVNMVYSKDECVTSDVFIESDDKVELVADIVSCRSLSERYKELFKKVKDANKCMAELGFFHDYLKETTKALTDRLESYQPAGTEGKKVNFRSDLYNHMKRMTEISMDLNQTVAKKAKEVGLEEELSREFSEVQNLCFQNFTDKFLYKKDLFESNNKGVMSIKSLKNPVYKESSPEAKED